jgi:hypothetical protein
LSYEPPGFVGSNACGECHQDIYDVYANSGHAWALNEVVNGQPPTYPFTTISEPPQGYTWDDISYVIGGYQRKALFVDRQGYVITGDSENATTQYNLANDLLGQTAEWVGYRAGEAEVPYAFGRYHTTGYSARGNQNDLPGLVGTWALPGVQCEACHGAGSLHVNHPVSYSMDVTRDAQSCGQCHVNGTLAQATVADGFIQADVMHGQLLKSLHTLTDCVICHDPHTGVWQLREARLPTTETACQACHFDPPLYQKVEVHQQITLDCVSCHMPHLIQDAAANPAAFTGDIRTHLMAIDPTQIEQFTADGSAAHSQHALNFACRNCHQPGGDGRGLPKTDEQLLEAAFNYHARPTPATPAPTAAPEATPEP